MEKIYTIKEVADITKQSIRTIQRRCKALNVLKVNSIYQINKSVLKSLNSDTNDKSDTTRHDNLIQEGFTPEEYEIFKKRLTDYPYLIEQVQDLKNQVEYFKKSLDKQALIFEKLTDSINNNLIEARERNAIEYKKSNEKNI